MYLDDEECHRKVLQIIHLMLLLQVDSLIRVFFSPFLTILVLCASFLCSTFLQKH